MWASPKGLVLLNNNKSGSTHGDRVPVLPGYLGGRPGKVKKRRGQKPGFSAAPPKGRSPTEIFLVRKSGAIAPSIMAISGLLNFLSDHTVRPFVCSCEVQPPRPKIISTMDATFLEQGDQS
jgi:hypothetical protein